MNQDFHILATMLGKYRQRKSVSYVMEYMLENVATLEMLDSFRCRLDRQITHFNNGSYWIMPKSLEEIKKSRPEDMQVYFSKESEVKKDYCVNRTNGF